MEKFRNKYRLPSTRLRQWDYGQRAAYFVTICTHDRAFCFGDVADGKMNLSGIGIIADVLWYEIKNHAINVELGEFVVMPNHVHGILIFNGLETNETTDVRPGADTHDNEPLGLDTHGDGGGIANIDGDAAVAVAGDIVGVAGDAGDVAGDAVETTHALSLHADTPNNPHHRHPASPQKTIGQQRFQNQGKNTLSSIIGSYKSAVTKHAHRLGYDFKWQSRFHEHIIRDDKSYRVISEYIINNPRRWNDDMFNGNHGN